jgi:glycerophosphoryl diester phosphodiesterase
MRTLCLAFLLAAGCSSAAPAPEPAALRTAAGRRAGVAVLLHRGCADLAPENTLDALELSFVLGADGVEIDLRRTRDGTIVLMHDEWIDRVLDGWGRVDQLTYEELLVLSPPIPNRRVATFKEVLDLCKRYHGLLHLDLKVPGIDGDVLRLIEEAGLADHVVTVNAENAGAIRMKTLPSLGSLIHGNDDYDVAAIRKKLAGAKAGTFLVDDPRAAVSALRRPVPEPDVVAGRIPYSPALPRWPESDEELVAAALAVDAPRRPALAKLILNGATALPQGLKPEELPEAVVADWLWANARLAARGRRVPPAVGAAGLALLLTADEEEALEAAAEACGETSHAEAVPILVKILAEHAPLRAFAKDAPAARIRLRAAAARALGRIGVSTPDVVEALKAAARDRSLHADGAWQGLDGAAAVRALARLDPQGSAALFKRLALRADPRLEEVEKRADLPEWMRKTGAWWDFRIKQEAIRALGLVGTPDAKAALEALLELSKEEADEAWRELHADAARALCAGAWDLRPAELRALLTHAAPAARRQGAAYLMARYGPAYRELRTELLPWAAAWTPGAR